MGNAWVTDSQFQHRQRQGIGPEHAAAKWLDERGHAMEFLGLAGTAVIDHRKDKHHKGPDLRCRACHLWVEVRSSVVGVTLAHWPGHPFWESFPPDTLVVHLRPGRVTCVWLGHLIASKGNAEVKSDKDRDNPYILWPWDVIARIESDPPRCKRK